MVRQAPFTQASSPVAQSSFESHSAGVVDPPEQETAVKKKEKAIRRMLCSTHW
jgi:hypothetical protein